MSIRVTPRVQDVTDYWPAVGKLQDELRAVKSSNEQAKRKIQAAWWTSVNDEFALSPDHVRLLKHLKFQLFEDTDLVSIGVEGKRPFGNGDWVEDVFRILGWEAEFDRDGMTSESEERARRIVAELPMALNEILAAMSPSDATAEAGSGERSEGDGETR